MTTITRCEATNRLEVRHKRADRGNGIENAIVLCQDCYATRIANRKPVNAPPPFDALTKAFALRNAGHRCECLMQDCH